MGIITGNVFKGLTFNGESSKNYGVYITGQAVYNSPERDVEMISIPGRDGSYAMDLGRFSNIEVRYPAGLFGIDHDDFADAISDFRNALGAVKGYARLEDEYNPNEYRMAVFKAGLEVTPASLESGEFDIIFDCKPQRFLKSGETEVTKTSGQKIENPTPFDSHPLLEVWGYGDIDLGGQTVTLNNSYVGWTQVSDYASYSNLSLDYSSANSGDTIQVDRANTSHFGETFILQSNIASLSSYTISNKTFTPSGASNCSVPNPDWHNGYLFVDAYWGGPLTATLGTASTLMTCEFDLNLTGKNTSNTTVTSVYHFTIVMKINADGSLTSSGSSWIKSSGTAMIQDPNHTAVYKVGDVWVDSTKSANGSPTYIDLDIGEAWYISGTDVISADSALMLPASLPTLPAGETTITLDGTVSQFKIVPRWWKL